MTTLGVNGIRLVRDRGGVARVLEALLSTLAEIPGQPFDRIRVYSPEPIDPAVRLPSIARSVVVPSALPPGLWEHLALPRVHGRRDVLLCPSYVVPVRAACPTLLIHHGSLEGYARAGEEISRWRRLKARISYTVSARRATTLVTVSESSRRDIARFYGISADRIHVIPPGVDTRLFVPSRDPAERSAWRRRALGDDVPFLLYVGKPTKRRNLPNLLRAFARLKRERRLPHKLVLVGAALPGGSFDALARELGVGEEIVTIAYVPYEEIALAYQSSSMLLYPSSHEGFGMPVLEAMACGTPVIALDNTALPEFAGGVALLLADAEVDTLAGGVLEILASEEHRARMAVEGPKRAARYDWRVVTTEYLELLSPLIPTAVD